MVNIVRRKYVDKKGNTPVLCFISKGHRYTKYRELVMIESRNNKYYWQFEIEIRRNPRKTLSIILAS